MTGCINVLDGSTAHGVEIPCSLPCTNHISDSFFHITVPLLLTFVDTRRCLSFSVFITPKPSVMDMVILGQFSLNF